jgi:hypothetical protein
MRDQHLAQLLDQPLIDFHLSLLGLTGNRRLVTLVADLRVIDGSLDERKFVATYHRDGAMTGAVAINSPKLFTRARKQLRASAS